MASESPAAKAKETLSFLDKGDLHTIRALAHPPQKILPVFCAVNMILEGTTEAIDTSEDGISAKWSASNKMLNDPNVFGMRLYNDPLMTGALQEKNAPEDVERFTKTHAAIEHLVGNVSPDCFDRAELNKCSPAAGCLSIWVNCWREEAQAFLAQAGQ